MSISQWLSMAVFILAGLACSLLVKIPQQKKAHIDLCHEEKAPLFLCAKKIALKDADVGDLAQIDGISVRLARIIRESGINNPDELIMLKGIGKKNLAKIKNYFY